MSIKLKRDLLPIVVAEPSDLPLGTLGEFITADTLKPYLDRIELSQTAAQVATAVAGLKTEILGGVDMSADSLAELNAKIGALQNITDADKTGLLAALSFCVKTADIMPILNGKAEEISVANRLASKVETNDIMPLVNARATKVELQAEYDARIAEDVRIETIANSKARATDVANLSTDIQREVTQRQQDVATLGVSISQKATPAEVTTISTALVAALRTEMLAIEGIDDVEFARLNALLAQLTALETADVTGLTALLSQKVAKSDVLDSAWLGNTLNDYINFVTTATDAQVGEGKVLDAIVLQRILKGLKFYEIDTKVPNSSVLSKSFAVDNWLGSTAQSFSNFLSESFTIGWREEGIFSISAVRTVAQKLGAMITLKANSEDVYTKTQSDAIMELLVTKAEVQTLREELTTANQLIVGLRTDVDLLKSYFEQAA